MWKEWRKEKHEKRLASIDLDVTKNLRFRSRTNEEQFDAEIDWASLSESHEYSVTIR